MSLRFLKIYTVGCLLAGPLLILLTAILTTFRGWQDVDALAEIMSFAPGVTLTLLGLWFLIKLRAQKATSDAVSSK